MSLSKKLELQNLEKEREELEEEYACLESMRTRCSKQIKGEGDWDKREQLKIKRKNYSDEIDELLKNLENIEKKINNLKSSSSELSSNNHLDNPKNEPEKNIDKSLCYIDFKKALEIFKNIQSQFKEEGDVALFLMEEHLIKRGDLYLRRLENDLKANNNYCLNFRHCPVIYTTGNLKGVIEGIGHRFGINLQEISLNEHIKLVIDKIGDYLQNNSVLFIEINCNINEASEIDPLIPWFIESFWQPLIIKLKEVIKKYEGIKVIAFITSKLLIKQRLSEEKISCYCNNNYCPFFRNKLVKLPLEKWDKDDIGKWLIKYVNPSLVKSEKDKIANRIYQETQGLPNTVYHALKEEWQTLTYPSTSC